MNRARKEKFAEYYANKFPGTDWEKSRLFAMRKLEFVGDRIEDIYEKDICELQRDEIKDGLETIRGGYYRNQTLLRIMRLYTEWCVENGICAENGAYSTITSMDVDGSAGQASGLVSGYREFAEYLDTIFHPVTEDKLDNMWRASCWLLFLGVSSDEIDALKNEDYSDGVLHISKGTIDVSGYPEVVTALETAKDQKSYSKGRGTAVFEDQSKLIKYNGKLCFKRAFTTHISKLSGKISEDGAVPLSANGIIKSGLFWRAKNAANEDEAASLMTRYVYSRYKSDESIIRLQLKQLRKEYQAWLINAE
ncbi:MAG: hypothetical protein ACI4WS_12905 [Oscillospiraceae bacterium]